MRTIAKFIFPFLLLLLLACYKRSDLSYRNSALSLQVDEKHLLIDGRPIFRKTDSFGNLYLIQEMLKQKSGRQVAYERVVTDPLYEFNLIPVQTIKVIFDAERVNVIYFKSSFYLTQLILRDGSVLNLIIEQFDDQRLTFAYGMSTSEMRRVLKNLDPNAPQKPMVERVVTLSGNCHTFLSQWSVQMVQLTPLIRPLRYNGGLFF